jgi:hypothetical protein
MYLQTCGSFKSAIKAFVRKLQIYKLQIPKSQQRLGPQIANLQSSTFAADPQISQICGVCDLRNLICVLPTLAHSLQNYKRVTETKVTDNGCRFFGLFHEFRHNSIIFLQYLSWFI